MIEYQQQDYDTAKQMIGLGFFLDLDKKKLEMTEENILDLAKSYYALRLRTFDPKTGAHL